MLSRSGEFISIVFVVSDVFFVGCCVAPGVVRQEECLQGEAEQARHEYEAASHIPTREMLDRRSVVSELSYSFCSNFPSPSITSKSHTTHALPDTSTTTQEAPEQTPKKQGGYTNQPPNDTAECSQRKTHQ